ncbi:hypothetical protein ACI2KT_01720 [Ensifer adhaerens]|jgi:hypothetical protein|uniref:Uncharacterized protein n=1 Tax=Ensifer adhaerens TaxID=106592 RepID=A0A9Q9DA61_ENSAD|nr:MULTISPECIES: hypothetical protein [Ensifer]MBD9555576.1 hypothetical protein [Ensifer sp. ENS03]MBD9592542.1 hypothetical protein [Ensifer sp. ENS05]MBD9635001.1 hypothetical protein [Ensifer sp. ENS07]USJ23889.1 hypothetical protein NE863_02520 [Ensifer adhaerens]
MYTDLWLYISNCFHVRDLTISREGVGRRCGNALLQQRVLAAPPDPAGGGRWNKTGDLCVIGRFRISRLRDIPVSASVRVKSWKG